VKNAYV
jgi:predicted nuclease with TOPRIM domain